jgi:hypothetical protein
MPLRKEEVMVRLLILVLILLPRPGWTSAMSDLCDCLLGPDGVASCKDVESQLALTRFKLNQPLEKGWVASADFSSVECGRPEDPMQAELFRYLIGNQVAILKSDGKGAMTTVSGILENIDFSDTKSSSYVLKNPATGDTTEVIISAKDQTRVEGFRVKPPKQGELQLLDFFRQYGIREDALARDRAIDRVYDQIRWLQSRTGQPDTASWIKIESRVLILDSNLISSGFRAIYNDWLKPFNEVQKAYTSTLQAEAEIKRLTEVRATITGDTRKYDLSIATLQLIANRNSETVGRYYQSVREAERKILEISGDARCDRVCTKNARIVSDTLGLPYPGKEGRSAMPLREELRQFVKNHPFAKFAQLREERNEQIKASFKSLLFQRPLLDAIDLVAKNTPGVNQTKAVQLLKVFYDAVARMKDFPKITAVLRNLSGPSAQIEQLRGLAAENPDVLISFARRVDTTGLWKELKTQAQTENLDLFSRMNDADKKARIYGDLALASSLDWGTVAALSLVLGGGFYLSYEGHHHQDSILDEIARMIGFDKKRAG